MQIVLDHASDEETLGVCVVCRTDQPQWVVVLPGVSLSLCVACLRAFADQVLREVRRQNHAERP